MLSLPVQAWKMFGATSCLPAALRTFNGFCHSPPKYFAILAKVIFTYPLQLHPCRRSLMILVQSIQGRRHCTTVSGPDLQACKFLLYCVILDSQRAGRVLSRSADRICRRVFTVPLDFWDVHLPRMFIRKQLLVGDPVAQASDI